MTEKPKTSINDAVQEGWGGSGNGVIGAPDNESANEYSSECRLKSCIGSGLGGASKQATCRANDNVDGSAYWRGSGLHRVRRRRVLRGGKRGGVDANAMRYSTCALVVVDVSGCRQGHVVLNQHILPRILQSLENGTLDLARVLQGQGSARSCVERAVGGEDDPGSDGAVDGR
jgi:hypothetical protein